MKSGKAGKSVKITLITIAAVIVLLIGGGYFYYFSILNSPQPTIDGQLQVKGLQDKVEVIRDSWGVPHIYAKNMHDLFFAQGYAQAQDRWWQMEFFRKTCGGRIEELTGKKASLVNTDIYLRSLGLYDVCKKEYDLYTPDQRAPMDAFAEGVNAYITGRSPGQLSVNYSILGLTGVKFKVEPWTPMDTLSFAKLMAWDLGLSRDLEITRTKLYSLLGPEMAEEWLVPAWPIGQKPTILLEDDIQTLEKSAPPAAAPSGVTSSQPAAMNSGQTFDDPSASSSSSGIRRAPAATAGWPRAI